jgi:hypothetical protein
VGANNSTGDEWAAADGEIHLRRAVGGQRRRIAHEVAEERGGGG